MTHERIDLERVGALLDGRLPAGERADAIARLDASPDDRAVFIDTAEVLRALEEEDAAADAPSAPGASSSGDAASGGSDAGTRPATGALPPRRVPRRMSEGVVVALAAAVVLAVAIPLLRRPPQLPTPEAALGALAPDAKRFPRDWASAWPPLRGGGSVEEAGALASRLGALHLRLAAAVDANDASAKAGALADVRVLLADEFRLLAADYAELAGDGVTTRQVADLGDRAAGFVGEDRFRIGAWAEAARLAAARRDAGFFRSAATRAALRRVDQLVLPEPVRAELDALRGVADADSPAWPDVERAATNLAAALTR